MNQPVESADGYEPASQDYGWLWIWGQDLCRWPARLDITINDLKFAMRLWDYGRLCTALYLTQVCWWMWFNHNIFNYNHNLGQPLYIIIFHTYCLLHVTRPMPFLDIVLSSSASCCNSLNFLWNSSKIFEWYFEHVYLILAQLWRLISSFQKCDFCLSGLKYSIHGMSSSTW